MADSFGKKDGLRKIVLAAVLGLVAQALPAQEASPSRWSLEGGYSHRFFENSEGDAIVMPGR